VTEKPRVTVFQNGICVQNNQEINGGTGIGGKADVKEGPIYLQYHNNTCSSATSGSCRCR